MYRLLVRAQSGSLNSKTMNRYICNFCKDTGEVDGKPCPKCRIVIHINLNYYEIFRISTRNKT